MKTTFRHDTSRWAEKFKQQSALLDYYVGKQELLSRVQHYAKNSILEVGVGTGLSSIALAQKGFNIVGIDLDKKVVKYAKEQQKNLKLGMELFVAICFTCLLKMKHSKFVLVKEHLNIIKRRKLLTHLTSRQKLLKFLVVDVPSNKYKEIPLFGLV